ncbi:hypothetical protein BDV96DRAFT_596181 [Lophiotrema nucula]|uniref:Glucose-methanol-choline oxidoreductase N-terminal domain-containing protein n=1 Tax=Lophiotrema nucula TaxID=690887 RepID=A0A6A5ZIU8_9PLEO|nr:hypothetical protein BDV96DRAFT_596181 [Lophiotrema nucula]
MWIICAVISAISIARLVSARSYDYVIVGGGTAGLVVANRLSKDGRYTVLVVERGSFDNKPEAIVPWYSNGLDTSVMLNFPSAPIPALNNATFSVPVAAAVGGGSVVNGMGYARGSKADYDAWEELGNPGWGWDALLPYFKRSTTFTPPAPEAIEEWNMTWDPSVYGKGPLPVTIANFEYHDLATFRDAWRHTDGVLEHSDISAGKGPGLYWAPATINARTNTRATSRSAYYDPINATRSNLELLTGHTVIEILFDGLKASGVRVVSRNDKSTFELSAQKEVVLAAGAVQTPQLLQRSGVGPTDVLKAAGVEVKKDLPAVGANFQDHATIPMFFTISNQTFPNPDTIAANSTYNVTVWDEYLANGTGPIAAPVGSTFVSVPLSLLTSSPGSVATDLLAQNAADFLPSSYTAALIRGFETQRNILAKQYTTNETVVSGGAVVGNGFAVRILVKPASRGTITLNASDPDSPPVVQYNTLSNPIDAKLLVAIVKQNRDFWNSPELAKYSPVEAAPGAQYQTDEEILFALTKKGFLFPGLAHASGTCAMMPEDLGGCVDPGLRVYGLEQLSIIDASIIPMIPSTALQATVYAIAEKAADLIRSRA